MTRDRHSISAQARRALIDVLERGAEDASVRVVSSRKKLAAAGVELGQHAPPDEDVFEGSSWWVVGPTRAHFWILGLTVGTPAACLRRRTRSVEI